MSNTYLQDFGLLRKQVNAREVNDPMSSAGRWDDLQLDMVKPNIPQPRRKPVRRNRTLTIEGITTPCRELSGKSSVLLGFHTETPYRHKLDTMKNLGYLAEARASQKPDQWKLYAFSRKPKAKPINDVIRGLVRKIRFGKTPVESVQAIYRRKLALLWRARNDL